MFAIHLVMLNNDLFDEDPAVIEHEFRSRGFSDFDYNRFMAAKMVMETNWYWMNLQSFMVLSDAITYGHVIGSMIPRPSMESMGWSIVEAVLLTPELEECKFLDDIIAYIEERAKYENEFAITLRNFIHDEQIKNMESPYLNNWIIVQTEKLIRGIDLVLEHKGENLNVKSIEDLRHRMYKLFEIPDNSLVGVS